MDRAIWITGDHELCMDLHGLHAVVALANEDGTARFLVFQPFRDGSMSVLVQSGCCKNVRQAMTAAEEMVEHLATVAGLYH